MTGDGIGAAIGVEDPFAAVEAVLLDTDPVHKAERSIALYAAWCVLAPAARQSAVEGESMSTVRSLPSPGRPPRPELVEPRSLARRGLGSLAGRIALLHSLAHIEFNAINLALDAVYRFRGLPPGYVDDWLRVASEEGEHFLLLHHRLRALDSHYGALPAHDGLWDMARRTEHDVLVRMALVPRILEARGLDVAPPMIERLLRADDPKSAAILQRIYTDEITHVEVGNRWFRHLCTARALDGQAVFRDLLRGLNSAYLRGPYNREARLEAGFDEAELALIAEMEAEYAANAATR